MIATPEQISEPPYFSTVIIGGGMLGAVLADRLYRRCTKLQNRILVVESGPLILRDHARNLIPAVPLSFLEPYNDTPWHSGGPLRVPGLIRALGGRSLIWGAWSPAPLASELEDWPLQVVDDLRSHYLSEAEKLLGVDEHVSDGGPLFGALRSRLFTAIDSGQLRHIPPVPRPCSLDAHIARRTNSGRIFSPVSLLLEASHEADRESLRQASPTQLVIVPGSRVRRLTLRGGAVTSIDMGRSSLNIGRDTNVILALGAIESTRLVLSVSNHPLIGRNLRGHVLSEKICSIPRAALGTLPETLQIALLCLQGRIESRHFHLQLSAASVGSDRSKVADQLAHEIPGVGGTDLFEKLSSDEVRLSVIGVGETGGDRSVASPNRVSLAVDATTRDKPAEVVFQPSTADNQVWNAMDEAMDDVMRAVKFQTAGVPSTMTSQLHPDSQRRPDLLVHEAGTMWMGDDPNTSVTDLWGRVHEAKNLFISGTALFPSVGSHNGSLTATALALRLADRLLAQM